MKTTRHVVPVIVLLMGAGLFLSGCAGLGVSRSGKKFNYDNVTKIKEHESTKEEVQALMEGEPTNTGRSGNLDIWTYQYSESAGASLWTYIPIIGPSLGKTTVTSYTATVYFDENVVDSVNYNKTETGSESAGI